MSLNITEIRQQFPSLHQTINGTPPAFLDGPGGTQTPQSVISAIANYLKTNNSNLGGAFRTSQNTGTVLAEGRQAMADFYNAEPNEIIFGANMTTLTMHISRSIAGNWQAGDEIIVTQLDHEGNVSPWVLAAEERGVTVKWLTFDPTDCTLRLDKLPELLTDKTRLLAITCASNAVGTIPDVQKAIRMAQKVGAWTFLDAVHYAPHDLIDVKQLDCDFLASSPYKYFGPHSGVLYGKYPHLEALKAYKVRPAPTQPPSKFETGTPSFEMIAGIHAAVDYIASLGDVAGNRRAQIISAMEKIKAYEAEISHHFLTQATQVAGLKVYGITDIERLEERTPTFAVSLEGYRAKELAEHLGNAGIFTWSGHYYALEAMRNLGLLEQGGLLRIGFVHYNSLDEVDRVLNNLAQIKDNEGVIRVGN